MQAQNIIGVKELRTNLDHYINMVQNGEELTVVKRSKVVFKISPVDEEWETVGDFIQIKKGGISGKKLLAMLKNGQDDIQIIAIKRRSEKTYK